MNFAFDWILVAVYFSAVACETRACTCSVAEPCGDVLCCGVVQEWSRFVGDYQALYQQLEVVESSIPSVGLVEETEERLSERIALYQVHGAFTLKAEHTV